MIVFIVVTCYMRVMFVLYGRYYVIIVLSLCDYCGGVSFVFYSRVISRLYDIIVLLVCDYCGSVLYLWLSRDTRVIICIISLLLCYNGGNVLLLCYLSC